MGGCGVETKKKRSRRDAAELAHARRLLDSPNAPASPPLGVRSCAGRMGTLGMGKKYLLVVTQERRTDTDSQSERASMTNRRSIPTYPAAESQSRHLPISCFRLSENE